MSASLVTPVDAAFLSVTTPEIFFAREEFQKIRREHEPREKPAIGIPRESCNTNLFFGFFFDGTKNNYQLAETTNNHSNVARLYDCYPGLSVPGGHLE